MNALKIYGLNGLGAQVPIDPAQPWLGYMDDGTGSEGGAKTSFWDSLTNVISKGTDIFNKLQPTIQQFTTGGSGSGFNPNLPAPNIPNQYTPNPTPPTFWQQHGTKVMVGTGLALGAGALIYASRNRKKGKK